LPKQNERCTQNNGNEAEFNPKEARPFVYVFNGKHGYLLESKNLSLAIFEYIFCRELFKNKSGMLDLFAANFL
jgi:glyoxylate utilization-related uncharacterized protein